MPEAQHHINLSKLWEKKPVLNPIVKTYFNLKKGRGTKIWEGKKKRKRWKPNCDVISLTQSKSVDCEGEKSKGKIAAEL